MNGVIACGQDQILGPYCVECEAPLRAGGIAAQVGRVCGEDCAADQTARIAALEARTHLNQRDLTCECPTCTTAGHPTPAERQEWADYQESRR